MISNSLLLDILRCITYLFLVLAPISVMVTPWYYYFTGNIKSVPWIDYVGSMFSGYILLAMVWLPFHIIYKRRVARKEIDYD